MVKFREHRSRIIKIICAALLLAPVLTTIFSYGDVFAAYGLVTTRTIQLSDSNASDTGVSYNTSFVTATTGNIQGIVIDFCTNDPIIGDTCTGPSSPFTVGASPTFSGLTGVTSPGSWTASSVNSGRTFELQYSSGGSVTSGTTISFAITNVVNPPGANTTFYARIFTFATTANVTTWNGTANGSATTNVVDAGGIALSTAQTITVTAKVQEQLTFCVGTHATSSAASATAQTSCGSLSSTGVTLGNALGVLSSSGPFVDVTTQYIIGTNAASGAVVTVKGATLTSGSGATITAIGSTAATSSAGSSQFGICTYEGTGSNLGFSGYTTYNSSNCSGTTQTAGYGSTGGNGTAAFGFNTTNTTSTYGDSIAKETAGSNSTGIVAMIGNISASQTAGIYTTTLTFIATGTY